MDLDHEPRTQQLIHELGGWAGCLGSAKLPNEFMSSSGGSANLGFLGRSAVTQTIRGGAADRGESPKNPKTKNGTTNSTTHSRTWQLGGVPWIPRVAEKVCEFLGWRGQIRGAGGFASLRGFRLLRQKLRYPRIHELHSAPISHENSRLTRWSSTDHPQKLFTSNNLIHWLK